jgi:geranylgeranyl transferase type-2 subunit beta
MIDRMDWIDSERLKSFIFDCQDAEDGGIADKPGNMADVFHTFFGIAGLSLLGHPQLLRVNAAFALPDTVLEGLGITPP